MWTAILTNLVLPLAVEQVKKYIDSTESKKDDKVLEIVQKGAEYLSKKGNNNMSKSLSEEISDTVMLPLQKSKLDI